MGFQLGVAAGGVADGLNSGMDIAGKLQAMQEAARIRAARRALGSTYMDDASFGGGGGAIPLPSAAGPQPPMPGQASVPRNTNPDAMMGPPAAPGVPLPPMAAPAPPAPPAAQPVATAPVGASGDPLSGTAAPTGADLQSTVNDANSTIKLISASVRKANPNIDPETLFEATRQHIEQMKGVRNEVKDYMVAQTENAKLQLQQQKMAAHMEEVVARIHGGADVATIKADAARDVADTNAGASGYRADRNVDRSRIAADAHVKGAEIGAGAGVTRAQIAADASRYRDDKKYKGLVYDKTLDAYVRINNAAVGAEGRVQSAVANAGGTPKPTQKPMGGTTPAKPAARAYPTAAAVAAAYKAGKIDRNTAATILKRDFGAQ